MVFCRLQNGKGIQALYLLPDFPSRPARSPDKTTIKADYLYWLQFSFYVTNVSVDLLPASVVGTVHRLRWQIELIFKQWKSLLRIHVLRGRRRERIECLVYGRLLAILMIQPVAACASWMARELYQRELSVHKLINWVKRGGRLVQAVYEQQFNAVLEELVAALPRGLCKQKRKRLSSRQMIEQEIPYMESFLNENTPAAGAAVTWRAFRGRSGRRNSVRNRPPDTNPVSGPDLRSTRLCRSRPAFGTGWLFLKNLFLSWRLG